MSDNELHSLDVCFNRMRNKSADAQERMLKWLRDRLLEDQRAKSAAVASMKHPELVPHEWEARWPSGERTTYDTPAEAIGTILEDWGDEDIVEVDGIAVVVQRFAVRVPTTDGDEIQLFDNRAKAEAFVAAMKLA